EHLATVDRAPHPLHVGDQEDPEPGLERHRLRAERRRPRPLGVELLRRQHRNDANQHEEEPGPSERSRHVGLETKREKREERREKREARSEKRGPLIPSGGRAAAGVEGPAVPSRSGGQGPPSTTDDHLTTQDSRLTTTPASTSATRSSPRSPSGRPRGRARTA